MSLSCHVRTCAAVFCTLITLLVSGGCRINGEKRTFEISVVNQTSEPITLWLTKDGPPVEEGWKSPEAFAIESPKLREPVPGVMVPPGKTATQGPVTGRFRSDTDAILRIYRGARSFSELLALSTDNPDRKDISLTPGANSFIVRNEGRNIDVRRAP